MVITISHPNEGTREYKINEVPITIGRSEDCSITINSEHISRQHLVIDFIDGDVHVKDITASNWVLYGDDKLEKNKWTAYFDFKNLSLPADYRIQINNEADLKSLVKKAIKKEQHGAPVKSSKKLLKTQKKRKKQKVKKQFLILSGLILLFLMIIIYYKVQGEI